MDDPFNPFGGEMRHRSSPIIASVALFFSLAGTGIAASHYLITNVNQIKPSVRHALHGRRGPVGPQGPQGPQGTKGTAAFDWGSVINVAPIPVELTTTTPEATQDATCPLGYRLIVGGFYGDHEITTDSHGLTLSDHGLPLAPGAWRATAHLDPGATTGHVAAWATCAPVS